MKEKNQREKKKKKKLPCAHPSKRKLDPHWIAINCFQIT